MNIIDTLKKIRKNLLIFIIFGEVLEESVWAFAPNQGITHALQPAKSLFAKTINSNGVVLPTLIIQGMGLLLNAAILYAIAVLEKEDTTKSFKQTVVKAIKSTVSAIVIAGLATFLMLAKLKLLIATYVVQSAIDIISAGKQLVTGLFNYFTAKNTHQPLNAEHTGTLRTDLAKKEISANALLKDKKENDLSSDDAPKNKATKDIRTGTKKLLMGSIFLYLTLMSFLPIPIIANIAQLGLVGLTSYYLADILWDRYQQYKKLNATNIADEALMDPGDKSDSSNSLSLFFKKIKTYVLNDEIKPQKENSVAPNTPHPTSENSHSANQVWESARTKRLNSLESEKPQESGNKLTTFVKRLTFCQ